MKNTGNKVHYFSAYPLKALNLSDEEYKSQLHLRTTGTSKPGNRIRVLPMANPYKAKDFESKMKKEKDPE